MIWMGFSGCGESSIAATGIEHAAKSSLAVPLVADISL